MTYTTSKRSKTETISENTSTEKLGITLPIALISRIDKLRGDIPRSRFIRRAIEYHVDSKVVKSK